jgi:metal-responsive CopG/Arc/MetJ family transcriptional regulator
MPSPTNGKNISIHFTEDELPLLDEFEQYRKKNYINRSGWVKQHMTKELTENKRPLAFR